jgi:hypothetical protein
MNWLFEWINKIDKPLAKLTKRKKTHISKIKDKTIVVILQQIPLKSRESLRNTMKTCS